MQSLNLNLAIQKTKTSYPQTLNPKPTNTRFIGLSSGYDSGAIHVALVNDGIGHFAYTVYSTEATLGFRVQGLGVS